MADVAENSGPEFRLEVLEGPEQGSEFPLDAGDIVVGRAEHCGVCLTSPDVAPTHFGLRVRNEQIIIAPGGRVNHTTLNGERLEAARLLRVGDVIGVGPYKLLVRVRLEGRERRLFPGDRVGRFRLLAELGVGAVGRVYEALDEQGQRVALKIMRLRHDWPSKQERHRRALFRREAKALRAVRHPNVVAAIAAGEHDGLPWIALEFLEGVTLREKLSAGRLPVREAERVMFQLCAAVAACHAAGVIHRDLKPANVMLVGDDETVKLADFGLAQPMGTPRLEDVLPKGISTAVRVGQQIGTPAYMPPEQTRGEEADFRSDVWSLGVMLYELLAGRRPFHGKGLRAVLTDVVEGCPESLPPELDAYLHSAVYKCLQKKPSWRFQSAVELVETVHEKKLSQLLPVGADGPPRPPITCCPHCRAPLENLLRCPQCDHNLYRYADGQVLVVPLRNGELATCCSTCATHVGKLDRECPTCERTFDLAPPAGITRTPQDLGATRAVVIDVYQQALAILEQCPNCGRPRQAEDPPRCRGCGLTLMGYVTGRLALDLAVGGWNIKCADCGCPLDEPDDTYCPRCGLNFANGCFPNGRVFVSQMPAGLRRRLDSRGSG